MRTLLLLPLAVLTLLGLSLQAPTDAAPGDRAAVLNVIFVNYCDGLDLRIRDRLGVVGTHTGCGFSERVRGETFTTADNENGVRVNYFDKTVSRNLRVDLYRTGFRAGKFYVYNSQGVIQRFGDWAPAPPAP